MLVAGTVIALIAAQAEPAVPAADVIAQAAATIPAVWLLLALALAAVGAAPAVRLAGWLGVVAAFALSILGTFALSILGPLFRLWDWILGISPLWHVPNVTAAAPDWSGLAWLTLIGLALLAVAFTGFHRRDLA